GVLNLNGGAGPAVVRTEVGVADEVHVAGDVVEVDADVVAPIDGEVREVDDAGGREPFDVDADSARIRDGGGPREGEQSGAAVDGDRGPVGVGDAGEVDGHGAGVVIQQDSFAAVAAYGRTGEAHEATSRVFHGEDLAIVVADRIGDLDIGIAAVHVKRR